MPMPAKARASAGTGSPSSIAKSRHGRRAASSHCAKCAGPSVGLKRKTAMGCMEGFGGRAQPRGDEPSDVTSGYRRRLRLGRRRIEGQREAEARAASPRPLDRRVSAMRENDSPGDGKPERDLDVAFERAMLECRDETGVITGKGAIR